MSASGGVELRNQLEFLVRGYQCFARLGQLTYLPPGLPGVQFKYQKPTAEMPPERKERIEAGEKARAEAAERQEREAEKNAVKAVREQETLALLTPVLGRTSAKPIAERITRKCSDATSAKEGIIQVAVGKLLYAEQLAKEGQNGDQIHEVLELATKLAEAAGINEQELDHRLAVHKAEEAKKSESQSQAAAAAQKKALTAANRPVTGGKNGKPDGTKGKKKKGKR